MFETNQNEDEMTIFFIVKVYFVSSEVRPPGYDLNKYLRGIFIEILPCLHACQGRLHINKYDICLVGAFERIISTHFVLNTRVEKRKRYKLTLIYDLCRK